MMLYYRVIRLLRGVQNLFDRTYPGIHLNRRLGGTHKNPVLCHDLKNVWRAEEVFAGGRLLLSRVLDMSNFRNRDRALRLCGLEGLAVRNLVLRQHKEAPPQSLVAQPHLHQPPTVQKIILLLALCHSRLFLALSLAPSFVFEVCNFSSFGRSANCNVTKFPHFFQWLHQGVLVLNRRGSR